MSFLDAFDQATREAKAHSDFEHDVTYTACIIDGVQGTDVEKAAQFVHINVKPDKTTVSFWWKVLVTNDPDGDLTKGHREEHRYYVYAGNLPHGSVTKGDDRIPRWQGKDARIAFLTGELRYSGNPSRGLDAFRDAVLPADFDRQGRSLPFQDFIGREIKVKMEVKPHYNKDRAADNETQNGIILGSAAPSVDLYGKWGQRWELADLGWKSEGAEF